MLWANPLHCPLLKAVHPAEPICTPPFFLPRAALSLISPYFPLVTFFIFWSGCSPTTTTAPSLRSARPEQFPYKVPVGLRSHHHPKVFLVFLFPTVGHNSWSGQCSHVPGSSYANTSSMFSSNLEGVDPSTIPSPWFSAPEGADPSTRSSSSFSTTHWTSQLLASWTPVRKPSCWTSLMSSWS
jgi:hypothetical protein